MDQYTYSVKTEYTIKRTKKSKLYVPKYTYIVNKKHYACVSNFSSNIRPSESLEKYFIIPKPLKNALLNKANKKILL